MQLHHCDRNDLTRSQHNLQQGLGPADGAASPPGPVRSSSRGQPWWVPRPGAGGMSRERRWLHTRSCCRGGRTADVTANGTSSAGVKPLPPVTPVTGLCHTATSSGCPRQGGHFSCARAGGASCPPQAAQPLPPHHHGGTATPSPPQRPQSPQAKHECKSGPAGISSLCFLQPGP